MTQGAKVRAAVIAEVESSGEIIPYHISTPVARDWFGNQFYRVSRYETDAVLKRHNVTEDLRSREEFDQQVSSLREWLRQ